MGLMQDRFVGEVQQWEVEVKCGRGNGVEIDQEAKLSSALSWTPVPGASLLPRHVECGMRRISTHDKDSSHRSINASSVSLYSLLP